MNSISPVTVMKLFREWRTSSVGGMLADFANKLRDEVPVAVAAGMVQLINVLHGLGL